MAKIISEHKPTLFLEVHPHLLNYGYSVDDVLRILFEYKSVRAFEEKIHKRFWGKMKSAYLGIDKIRELKITDVQLEVRSGKRKRSFWLVCKG